MNHAYVTGQDTRLISKWRDVNENAWFHLSLSDTQSKTTRYIEAVSKPNNAVKQIRHPKGNQQNTPNGVAQPAANPLSKVVNQVVEKQQKDEQVKVIQQLQGELNKRVREVEKVKRLVDSRNAQIKNLKARVKSDDDDDEPDTVPFKRNRLTQSNVDKASQNAKSNKKSDDTMSQASDTDVQFCPLVMAGQTCSKPSCKLNHSSIKWKQFLENYKKA